MATLTDAALAAARLLLSLLFVVEGWLKIRNYAGVLDYMAGHGIPGVLLPAVIALELGGGLLVAAGLFTRWAALALAGFCLLTALLIHGNVADGNEFIQFGKNLGIAGGFLALAVAGAGRWSLDARRARSD